MSHPRLACDVPCTYQPMFQNVYEQFPYHVCFAYTLTTYDSGTHEMSGKVLPRMVKL